MKKKTITILLAVCLALSMTACGESETPETANSSSEDVESHEESAEPAAEDADSTPTEITIDEQELYNENGVVITATGFSETGIFGPEVKLLIENNSEENITVQARNGSVNGYMVDFQISSDVAAGKKTNDALSLLSTDLENSNISTICDIEFNFHIFKTDSWEDLTDSELITIATSASGSYEQSYDDSGEVIYDENGVKIISKGISEDGSLMGPALYLYIENNSEQDITIQSRDTSINGFMVDPILSSEIVAGKKSIDTMVFLSSDLTDNGIETIDEIETSFHIFTTENWDTIVDTDPIVISCK